MDTTVYDILEGITFKAIELERTDAQMILHLEQAEEGFRLASSAGIVKRQKIQYTFEPEDANKPWILQLAHGQTLPMRDPILLGIAHFDKRKMQSIYKYNSIDIRPQKHGHLITIYNTLLEGVATSGYKTNLFGSMISEGFQKYTIPEITDLPEKFWRRIYHGEILNIKIDPKLAMGHPSDWHQPPRIVERICMAQFDKFGWKYEKRFAKEIYKYIFLKLIDQFEESKNKIQIRFEEVADVSSGQFHPSLSTLFHDDYIRNTHESSHQSGHIRYIFKLSPRGKELLHRWEVDLYKVSCYSYVIKNYNRLYGKEVKNG